MRGTIKEINSGLVHVKGDNPKIVDLYFTQKIVWLYLFVSIYTCTIELK